MSDHSHHNHTHDHSHHGQSHHDHRHYGHALEWQGAGGAMQKRAFVVGAALNIGFVLIEYLAGWWADSMALIADASHNLTDVLGLLMAFVAVRLAARLPSQRYTYGMGSATILAALGNGLLLIFICGALTIESINRFIDPEQVATTPVMIVAAIGAIINFATAKMFHGHSHGDVNMRGVYIHMLGDAGVSVAVVIGALIMQATGISWIDPLLGLAIVATIIISTWNLLRESVELAMQGVPRSVDAVLVKAYLEGLPGVSKVHDIHIWGLSTTETAMTAHLIMPDGHPGDEFIEQTTTILANRFKIVHATLQIETSPHTAGCAISGIQ